MDQAGMDVCVEEGARCAIDGRPMEWVEYPASEKFICNACCRVARGDRWHCDEHQDDCCVRCHPRFVTQQSQDDSAVPPSSSIVCDERLSTSDVIADLCREMDLEQSI